MKHISDYIKIDSNSDIHPPAGSWDVEAHGADGLPNLKARRVFKFVEYLWTAHHCRKTPLASVVVSPETLRRIREMPEVVHYTRCIQSVNVSPDDPPRSLYGVRLYACEAIADGDGLFIGASGDVVMSVTGLFTHAGESR